MTPSIQRASKDDLPVLLHFIQAYHEFEQVPHEASAVEQALEPLLLSNDVGCVWLIEFDEKLIGYIVLCFGYSIEFLGRDAFIDELFIVPAYRGKGIGKAVLKQVQSEAKKLGVKALHLEVERHNERAQRLYSAVGFEPRERFFLMSHRLSKSYNSNETPLC